MKSIRSSFHHFVFLAIFIYSQFAVSKNKTNSFPIRLEGDSKVFVGAYYFGVFNQSFRTAYSGYILNWPQDVQQRPLIWWYGVEDLFKKQGSAYRDLVRLDPTYDTSYLKPAIGFHDNSQVEILEKHIDQAANGGLDYFNFYWYWSKSANSESLQDGLYAFKQARNKQKLKFHITMFLHPWDPDHNLTADSSGRALDQIILHAQDPQYLKIEGRPVITIGDARNIKNGRLRDLQDMMGYIRLRFNEAQVGNPIILIHPGAIENWNLAGAEGYQCLVPSPGLVVHNGNYNAFVDDQPNYFQAIRNLGLPFSPCVASQFDERPRYKVFIDQLTDLRYLNNFSMAAFDRSLSFAASAANTSNNGIANSVNVYAWNEWHEGGIIEPSERYGSRFLEAIESNLKTRPLHLFMDSNGQKVATSAFQVSGYTKIKSWKLFSEFRIGQNEKQAIFECKINGQNGSNRFISGDRNCEGQPNVNGSLPIGFVLNSVQAKTLPMKLIYRCNSYGQFHFVSEALDCERRPGQNIVNEGPIGYVPL